MSRKRRKPARSFVIGAAVLVAAGLCLALVAPPASPDSGATRSVRNKALVQASFDAWAAGTGGPYDLLADDARWTIAGRSAVSGTYFSREALLRRVIRPFDARMRDPLKPHLREVYTDGDVVAVLFDAGSVTHDGQRYADTYTWYLRLHDERIVSATAFFDSIAFDEVWQHEPAATASDGQ